MQMLMIIVEASHKERVEAECREKMRMIVWAVDRIVSRSTLFRRPGHQVV